MALTTLPTAALANDAVDNTKLNLADNYAFTGTISGIPNDIELISTNHITTASVPTCDFTSFSNDYTHLIVKISDFEPSGNNGQLVVRLQTTGSGGFASGSGVYENTRTRVYAVGTNFTSNQSGFTQNYGVGGLGQNSSGNGYFESGSHGDFYFNNIHSTTRGKGYWGVFWGGTDSGNSCHQVNGCTFVGSGRQDPLTGIRFLSTSGDIKGRFSLYGVRT